MNDIYRKISYSPTKVLAQMAKEQRDEMLKTQHFAQVAKEQQAEFFKKILNPTEVISRLIHDQMEKARIKNLWQNASAYIKEMSIAEQLHNVSALAVELPKIEFPNFAADYVTAMNMAIKESTVFDYFKIPVAGITNAALDSAAFIHHTDMPQNLLRPLIYLEQHAKTMNAAIIGRDALHITAFSAIHAVETQFKFFQQYATVEESFLYTPLYSSLNQFSDLDLDDFETEEDWNEAFLDRIEAFLRTKSEESQKYALNFMRYIAKKRWELFSIALTFYIFAHSPSLQDVQDVGQKVDDVQTQNEEQSQRLAERLDSIFELLKKSHNLPTLSEAQVLYCTINDVEVKSEPNANSSSIAALAINEPIEVVETQNDEWVQIEFFDYIHEEIRKGWIQTNDVEPLVSKTEPDANPIDEVVTLGSQRLKEASDCIHNRTSPKITPL